MIPGSGRSPGRGKGQPIPVFLPGKSHGQRNLVGYSIGCSPWGHTESDTPWEPGQEAEFYSISFLARIVHQWYSLSLLFPRIPAVTPLICRRTAGRQVSENCLATYCSVATSPGALPLPPPSPGTGSTIGILFQPSLLLRIKVTPNT